MKFLEKHKLGLIITGIVLAVCLFFVSFLAGSYNNIISLEEQVNESYSNIEVQEKRRADLIPNFVDSVQDYKDFEKIDQDQIDLYYILNDNKNNIEFLDEDLVAISKKEEEIKALKAKEKEEFDFQMEELVNDNQIKVDLTGIVDEPKEKR